MTTDHTNPSHTPAFVSKTLGKIAKAVSLCMVVATLTSCASTGGVQTVNPAEAIGVANNVGMAVFQSAVNQKCQSELTNNQYWKMASIVMTSQQKTQVAENVCGCVTQKAPQSVTMVDMATAAVDSNARTQIVAKAVSNTLQSCVAEFVK